MTISMQQVKELRDRTQAGLNDCKNALSEASGDIEKAVEIILKKGLAKSAKRAGAVAAEGVVAARVLEGGLSGVIVEVNIQTDFAAKNPDFLAFVEKAVTAAATAPAGEDLGAQPFEGSTLEEHRAQLVGRLGENITLRRWARLNVEHGLVHAYVHMGGKVAALVALEVDAAVAKQADVVSFADEVAMQAAAMGPRYLVSSEVPDAEKAKQAEIFDAQLRDEGKPEAVRPKIVEGKVAKWLKEVCLLEQVSVLDGDSTIAQRVAQVAKAAGGAVSVKGFVRYERGEGIEKQGDDFAAEAQRMAEA